MKNEKKILLIIFALVAVLCVAFYGFQTLQPKDYVVVKHNNEVVLRFDLHKDDTYEVQGDIGTVHIEVRDGRYRVYDVDCPNHDCESMGWADKDSFLPITCLPNNVVLFME